MTDEEGKIWDLNGRVVTHTNNLSSLPALTLGEVFAYLVVGCQWEPHRLSSYAQDDGYLLFKDNHVEDVSVGRIADHNKHMYVVGQVKPEQRQTAKRYSTWILIDSASAAIKSAGCQCVAACVFILIYAE